MSLSLYIYIYIAIASPLPGGPLHAWHGLGACGSAAGTRTHPPMALARACHGRPACHASWAGSAPKRRAQMHRLHAALVYAHFCKGMHVWHARAPLCTHCSLPPLPRT